MQFTLTNLAKYFKLHSFNDSSLWKRCLGSSQSAGSYRALFIHSRDSVITKMLCTLVLFLIFIKITVFSLSFMHAQDTSHRKFSLIRMINSGAKSAAKVREKVDWYYLKQKITHLIARFPGIQKQCLKINLQGTSPHQTGIIKSKLGGTSPSVAGF